MQYFFKIFPFFTAFLGSKESVHHDPSVIHYNHKCFTTKVVQSDYIPIGKEWRLGDMNIYETGTKSFNRVLIAAYDIFGYHSNTKQVADILAEEFGFRVVMPDFFRGVPWNFENFPPDPQELMDFINTRGNWEKSVRTDVINIMNHYRTKENIKEFGIFGFCWGGKIATRAAVDLQDIKAAVLIHPLSVTNDEANEVNAPMYLLPSKDEEDMLPFYAVLQKKFGSNSGHRRFQDMDHGFAGARGNFTDPLNALRVNEVIDITGHFFNKNLKLVKNIF